MAKQTLYIITGLPYAGKSTLTEQLIKKFDFAAASVDEFINKGKYAVDEMTQEDWNYVYSQAFKKLEGLLAEGKSVIFDGASLKRTERDTSKGIAEKQGVPSSLIYVKTNMEEIKRRQLKNKKLKTRGHVKIVTLKKAGEMFEEPTADENAIIYNGEVDLGEWIEENFL